MNRSGQFRSDLDSDDPAVVTEAAFQLADAGCREAVPQLLSILDRGDLRTNNGVAYALGELKVQEAKPRLIELLRDPKTLGNRGSLMYGLMCLDCSDDFAEILPFMFDDAFEVRAKVLVILEAIVPTQVEATLEAGVRLLETTAETIPIESEIHADLDELLDLIDAELDGRPSTTAD
ncbi:HEAT repeat domain-containing protein [Isosphaeraceae bacterium EP7]